MHYTPHKKAVNSGRIQKRRKQEAWRREHEKNQLTLGIIQKMFPKLSPLGVTFDVLPIVGRGPLHVWQRLASFGPVGVCDSVCSVVLQLLPQ